MAGPPVSPSLTADVLCLSPLPQGRGLRFLAVERRFPPYAGHWALPGGFVEVGEDPAAAAARELAEETGLRCRVLEQLGAWGAPDRDPRRHTVTVAYRGLAAPDSRPRAGDDAARAQWHDALDPPPLAFDHREILEAGLAELRARLDRDDPPPGWVDSLGPRARSGDLLALHSTLAAGPVTASQLRRWRRRGLWPPSTAAL